MGSHTVPTRFYPHPPRSIVSIAREKKGEVGGEDGAVSFSSTPEPHPLMWTSQASISRDLLHVAHVVSPDRRPGQTRPDHIRSDRIVTPWPHNADVAVAFTMDSTYRSHTRHATATPLRRASFLRVLHHAISQLRMYRPARWLAPDHHGALSGHSSPLGTVRGGPGLRRPG